MRRRRVLTSALRPQRRVDTRSPRSSQTVETRKRASAFCGTVEATTGVESGSAGGRRRARARGPAPPLSAARSTSKSASVMGATPETSQRRSARRRSGVSASAPIGRRPARSSSRTGRTPPHDDGLDRPGPEAADHAELVLESAGPAASAAASTVESMAAAVDGAPAEGAERGQVAAHVVETAEERGARRRARGRLTTGVVAAQGLAVVVAPARVHESRERARGMVRPHDDRPRSSTGRPAPPVDRRTRARTGPAPPAGRAAPASQMYGRRAEEPEVQLALAERVGQAFGAARSDASRSGGRSPSPGAHPDRPRGRRRDPAARSA